MAALSAFSKICQKSFLLADTFQLEKYQILAVINVPTTRKKQQGSGKFRICKVLIVKFEKNLSCLHLKEISRAIFLKTLVVQN